MKKPALIFDFGNVIAFFDFERATAKLGARLGMTGRELFERLGPLGFKELLQDYERGRLASGEFRGRLLRLISLEITHDEFVAAWTDIFTANESIVPLIENLKAQGYRLVLGSNTNDIHATHFRKAFASPLDHFDRLVLSHEVGHLKPHREFYLACAEAAGMPPADCVFIDDLIENIEGARSAGLTGLVYESTPKLIEDLGGLKVEIGAL